MSTSEEAVAMKLLSKKRSMTVRLSSGRRVKSNWRVRGGIRKPGSVHPASQLVLLTSQHFFGDQLL
jgi:hypothetical protein